jgi:hypothetical protein
MIGRSYKHMCIRNGKPGGKARGLGQRLRVANVSWRNGPISQWLGYGMRSLMEEPDR